MTGLPKAETMPSLVEVFGKRPGRMGLLDSGLERLDAENSVVLEIGCSVGEASAHVASKYGCIVSAIDISSEDIEKAKRSNGHPNVRYETARAEAIPFEDEKFDVVFSEAAFSLLKEKEKSVSEYRRVLKGNGCVLINDFTLRNSIDESLRGDMDFIPCFAGVDTKEGYIKYFEEQGFELAYESDESKEIVKTAMWIAKAYKTPLSELSGLFSGFLSKNDPEKDSGSCECFFQSARLGYVQLIFRKGGK